MHRAEVEMSARCGCVIGVQNICNVRYANDVTLMKKLARAVKRHSESVGLKITEAKTNVMVLNGVGPAQIDETEIELVQEFKYLVSMISMKSTTSEEIRVGRATARSITSDFVNNWKDDEISMSLKKRFVYACVSSIVQYGCESWALNTEDKKRIHAFEIWV